MKQLLYMPFDGFLFWIKARTALSKHNLSHYGRYFSAVRTFQEIRPNLSGTPVLGFRTNRNFYIEKRLLSNAENPVILTDCDVWLHPKLTVLVRDFYYLYILFRQLDDFSVGEFKSSAEAAVLIVTKLLSKLRFSDLEGLLTPECKEQVEGNINKYWTSSKLPLLDVKHEHVVISTPCESVLISDKKNEEKMLAEIRVILYAWAPFPLELADEHIKKFLDLHKDSQHCLNNLHMLVVFNSKFIKEITKGNTDQWTMSAINLKIFPSYLKTIF